MAIRLNDWKLITNLNGEGVGLFNLSTNVGETKNLATQMPEIASALTDQQFRWCFEISGEK